MCSVRFFNSSLSQDLRKRADRRSPLSWRFNFLGIIKDSSVYNSEFEDTLNNTSSLPRPGF